MVDANIERECEWREGDHGWLPPRQSDAEAIEQALMVADRYRRQFLRLLQAFRDMRRTIGAVIMTCGQLNVAERIQQVNVVGGDPSKAGDGYNIGVF